MFLLASLKSHKSGTTVTNSPSSMADAQCADDKLGKKIFFPPLSPRHQKSQTRKLASLTSNPQNLTFYIGNIFIKRNQYRQGYFLVDFLFLLRIYCKNMKEAPLNELV